MYKLNKNKLYYKSDQITTSVQRLNSMSEYSNVGTTLYLGRRRRDLNTTYIQRHVFAGMARACFRHV